MNEKITSQLDNGTIANPFTSHCKKSWSSRESQRVMHMLLYLRTGLTEPQKPTQHIERLDKVKAVSTNRQLRYFGAWSLDQWDYAAEKLRQMGHDESEVDTYKDDFISLLHKDFESGLAYEYADEWYQSYPDGGFFNPIRYKSLYANEIPTAHAVEEHLQCKLYQPAVTGFMSFEKPMPFDHNFVKNAGGLIVNYPDNLNIQDILAGQVSAIDEYAAEMIGEDESSKHGQRVFVTASKDYDGSMRQCVVYYAGFDTQEQNTLSTSVRNSITECIPTDYFRDHRVYIDIEPIKLMKGQLDMCEIYLAKEPKAMKHLTQEHNAIKHPTQERVDLSQFNHTDDSEEAFEEMFRVNPTYMNF